MSSHNNLETITHDRCRLLDLNKVLKITNGNKSDIMQYNKQCFKRKQVISKTEDIVQLIVNLNVNIV
jgi:hypothetical protein